MTLRRFHSLWLPYPPLPPLAERKEEIQELTALLVQEQGWDERDARLQALCEFFRKYGLGCRKYTQNEEGN